MLNSAVVESDSDPNGKMWVFGYGGMIWDASFPFVQKVPGCVTGYVRRFWMASEEYLGVPDKVGRVVTLVPTRSPKDMVWGVSYEIHIENEERIVSELQYREGPGYVKETATFYPVLSNRLKFTCTVKPFDVALYIPTDDNLYYMKDEPLEETASCIANAYGPGGSNADYLFQLASEVRIIAPNYDDTHLRTLECAVRELQADSGSSQHACGSK